MTEKMTPQAGGVQLAPSRAGRVYVAGPMTGYAEFNFPAFHAAAAALRADGIEVVNPAEHGIVDGAEWEDYLRFDIAKIAVCESIALLPGWSKSRGAVLEVHVARALGMPMRFLEGAEQPVVTPAVVADILAELARATRKFPTWPTDPLHALTVVGEEFGELTKDMLQLCYEPHKSNRDKVRTEALQTAAMALRLAMSLERYEYKAGPQHSQAETVTPQQAGLES